VKDRWNDGMMDGQVTKDGAVIWRMQNEVNQRNCADWGEAGEMKQEINSRESFETEFLQI